MAVKRLLVGSLLAVVAAAPAFALLGLHAARASGHSCGAVTVSRRGTVYRVLFAKNGAVQQYVLLHRTATEQDHDVLVSLQRRYGVEGVNAPPVRITGFRSGSGGMMIPEKAVDSCGRAIELR